MVGGLWWWPRPQAPTGTLVVVAAGRSATTLPPAALQLRASDGSWLSVGTVAGDVPAAPAQRQLLEATLPAGAYDSVRVGARTEAVAIVVTPGKVEPLLLGVDAGGLAEGAAYAGNDDVNLGLGELAGRFVPMPPFALTDQEGKPFDLRAAAGRDLVIAAFHTTCHETCPLYTALFLQLARRTPKTVMLAEVTTDPATDTPAVLSRYAAEVGAGWTFATGSAQQLADFWKPFGVELSSGDTHVSTLALIDRHGYVRLVYRGVPGVGGDIPPALVTTLSSKGLAELASGGDGWGAPDVLAALGTVAGAEQTPEPAGAAAPALVLGSTAGGTVRLADYAGTPVVINFWATYCPPCRAELPLLSAAVPRAGARLVLVNEGESAATARAYLGAAGIAQDSLLDPDLAAGRAYGVAALPVTVFVRRDGRIDRRQVGALTEAVLSAELSNLGSQ